MKKIALVSILSVLAFAGENGMMGTDFIPRSINFIIFVAILWYLVGNKIVAFFQARKEKIAKQFQEVQDKLNESKAKREALKAELENAKVKAKEIVETAKKEASLIESKIKTAAEEEIKVFEKHFEEFKESEKNRLKREVVKEFLDETLKDIHISSEDAAKIILKVA